MHCKHISSRKYTLLFFVLYFINLGLAAAKSEKLKIGFNYNWHFSKDLINPTTAKLSTNKWQQINIPHTWNNLDVMDDAKGYFRGIGWYRKAIKLEESYKGKNIYLDFEGANQVTELFINGKRVGLHTGGYTRFNFRIDDFLNFEAGAENVILVKVDNAHNDNIPPLSGDFTFFGGIYRDVNLVVNNPIHFSLEYGANGVFISTPTVSDNLASIKIKTNLENNTTANKKLKLSSIIKSPNGKIVLVKSSTITLEKGKNKEFVQDIESLIKPELWSPENPNLYSIITTISDNSGKILDEVINSVGFRWYKFDAEKGFFLNGKPYKLIGASRHQDFDGIGNALTDDYHVNDVKYLKNMGANFLRIAHYPQDETVLETCDRLGILTSVETPIVNAITETEEFSTNCLNMQLEMIKQNFNHPSIVIWAYMNEVFLRPKFTGQKERQKEYFGNIKNLAQKIETLTRSEDPSRYTMVPNYGYYEIHKDYGIIDIPMIVGWNLYQGWYSGKKEDFGRFLDRCHKDFPDKPIMVTEYGADADPRIRTLTPKKFDKSVDFSLNFHQYYLREMNKRPFVSAALIWNLADFNSEQREETMPHINNKGLLTLDRKPKDLYYYYQSQLLKSPFIKISNWLNRAGEVNLTGQVSTQPIEVFSNAKEVELFVNQVSVGKITQNKGGRFNWDVDFVQGNNTVVAKAFFNGIEVQDKAEVNFNIIDFKRNNTSFNQLNVLLGAKRFYTDPKTNQAWIPSQVYLDGSWGFTGGNPFSLADTARQSYGTDRNIKSTFNDPIYQTQQVGIQSFKLDVPDGEYELSLHFAELLSGEVKEALAYNLNDSNRKDNAVVRVFDVLVNDNEFLKDFNIKDKYGVLTPGIEKLSIVLQNNKGLTIKFLPKQGAPILSALQLRRIR
jgi:beta-galactosidase